MIRVGVLGAPGRMGQLVSASIEGAADLTLAAQFSRSTPLIDGSFSGCDVIIDFSSPEALLAAVPAMKGIGLVSGTTGLSDAHDQLLNAHAQSAPVLVAANFSTGVNVLLDVVAQAARVLADYDLEIVEAHHRHKRDAPSGTALALGRAAAAARGLDHDAMADVGRTSDMGVREPGRIGYHAIRGGDVAGEHTVWLAADGERIELRHVASSRQTFADGALRAARWLVNQPPGRYTMGQALGL